MMQAPIQYHTLLDRCATMVAHANALTQFMPFTIIRLQPDSVDERLGYVLIRLDDATQREAVMVMNWLCPATVAEAATRAWVYAAGEVMGDGTGDDDDPEQPKAPPNPQGVLH